MFTAELLMTAARQRRRDACPTKESSVAISKPRALLNRVITESAAACPVALAITDPVRVDVRKFLFTFDPTPAAREVEK